LRQRLVWNLAVIVSFTALKAIIVGDVVLVLKRGI
jgi:hypothetical protein